MKKLKTALASTKLYKLALAFALIFSLLVTLIPTYKSKYKSDETEFTCKLEEYKIDGNKLELNLNCKEKLIGTYYFKTEEEKIKYDNTLKLGSTLKINGTLSEPPNNTTPYIFNYKKYLYNQKIYYLLSISDFKETEEKISLFYKIKNFAYTHAKNIKNNTYIYAYILGKTYKIKENVLNSYRTNGISHLFALSGLHVGIFSLIIMKILKLLKLKDLKIYIVTFLILMTFAFITGFSPSILRSALLFFFLGINKIYKLNIKTINILYLTFSCLVIFNPFIIYNLSFILSFTSTYFIILTSDKINDKNYIKGLLKVSTVSFISNIGLSVYYFNSINPVGILLNILFVPFVTFLVFPLCLIVYIFPFLSCILYLFTLILEKLSLLLNNLSLQIYFAHISLLEVILFYILLSIFINYKNKKSLILLMILVLFWKIKPIFNFNTEIYFIDVGQGDSALIVTPHRNKAILIDTGGKVSFNEETWQERNKTSSIATYTLIPLMRNLGINKLDYLILSHGDQDHAGEALNLIYNFKVDKIYINKGEINILESKIENKTIINFESLKIDNMKLTSLNKEIFNDENDNSIVLLAEIENTRVLFMGDGSAKTENSILKNYDLDKVDILKVGHHGSKTSSGDAFINAIKPTISIISSGLNNRYNHPDKEVTERLSSVSTIYNTAYDGTIKLTINDIYKITTFAP